MKLLLGALSLVCALGFSRLQTAQITVASADDAVSQPQNAGAPSEDETGAICPIKWTCDSPFGYYNLKADCFAACGTACYRDYACNGNCVCP